MSKRNSAKASKDDERYENRQRRKQLHLEKKRARRDKQNRFQM